jgi:hypothetical protein
LPDVLPIPGEYGGAFGNGFQFFDQGTGLIGESIAEEEHRQSEFGNAFGEKADIGSYFQLFRAWKPGQHGFLEINKKNRTVGGPDQTLISLYFLRRVLILIRPQTVKVKW